MKSQGITDEQSRQLSTMGFICAFLVVIIHATPSPILGSWQWWVVELLGKNGLCRVAVPYFFLVAGFFLARHFTENGWYGRELQKRVRSLLLPYLIFLVVYLLVDVALYFCISFTGHTCNVQSPLYGPWWRWMVDKSGLNPFKTIGVLWFVRNLFALVLVSPIILRILRKTHFLLPIVSFVALLIVGWLTPKMSKDTFVFFEYSVNIRGLLYFSLGMCVCMWRWRVRGAMWLWVICAIIVLIMRALCKLNGFASAAALIDVAMVPFSFALILSMRNLRLPRFLTSQSFPVFLLHGIILKISLPIIVVTGFRQLMDTSLIIAVLRVVLAVAASTIIALTLKNRKNSIASLIFGGR